MKPIDGIVKTKESIPDSFRDVDRFTTDVLSKLWKVYTVNRDVVEKGCRLENIFWRIWASERNNRRFSGERVATLFMRIYNHEDIPSTFPRKDITYKPTETDCDPESSVARLLPRPPLEVEYPPTPPPSPVSGQLSGGLASHVSLSKKPELTKITASLEQVLPLPTSSPSPQRRVVRTASSPSPVSVLTPPSSSKQAAASPNAKRVPPLSSSSSSSSPSQKQQLDQSSQNREPLSTVEENKASEWISTSFRSNDSRSSRSGVANGGNSKLARAERLRRGHRKKVGLTGGRATRSRGIPPPLQPQPQLPLSKPKPQNKAPTPPKQSRKGKSELNTVRSTEKAAKTPTATSPRSVPNLGRTPLKRQNSLRSEPDSSRKEPRSSGGAWIVDPDFRTKYIEQKQKVLAMTARASPTTAVVDSMATAHTSRDSAHFSSKRVSREGGRRKNVLVVDDVVPLKCVDEETIVSPVTGRSPPPPSLSKERRKQQQPAKENGGGGQFAINLPRQKSQLTMLFENAKKKGGGSPSGDAEPSSSSSMTSTAEKMRKRKDMEKRVRR